MRVAVQGSGVELSYHVAWRTGSMFASSSVTPKNKKIMGIAPATQQKRRPPVPTARSVPKSCVLGIVMSYDDVKGSERRWKLI